MQTLLFSVYSDHERTRPVQESARARHIIATILAQTDRTVVSMTPERHGDHWCTVSGRPVPLGIFDEETPGVGRISAAVEVE